MKSIFQNYIIHSLPILLILVGGCESPDFRYPDVENKPKYKIDVSQVRAKDSVRLTVGASPVYPIGNDTTPYAKDYIFYFEGEIVSKVGVNRSIKTKGFIDSGLILHIDGFQFDVPLPPINDLLLARDTNWILETHDDIKLVIPLSQLNPEAIDSYFYYGSQIQFTGIIDNITGDVHQFEPDKFYSIRDFVIHDSLVYYPFSELGLPRSRKDWNTLSKTQKADAIDEIAKLQLPLYHISTIRQFQRESPKIVKSANPFRIPENISPLDEDGIFYGQFTAMEVIRFK